MTGIAGMFVAATRCRVAMWNSGDTKCYTKNYKATAGPAKCTNAANTVGRDCSYVPECSKPGILIV